MSAGQPLGAAWDHRDLIAAARDHDLLREVNAVRRFQHKAMLIVAAQLTHGDAFQQGRIERGDEGVHICDDLVAQHEAVRVRPLIGKARQLALPVRRHETK